MSDDLLDAKESVNWAIAQIEILKRRIRAWVQSRPYIAVIEPDSDCAYEIVKARLVGAPLPAVVNAETGAIINMIRSSLDLLAVALAQRNGAIDPKDVYFPIAACLYDYIDPKDGAFKKIARLSETDQKRIKSLKPYKGGDDDLLYSLHQLDVMRKHRRLVKAEPRIRNLTLFRVGHHPTPERLYPGTLEDGAPILRISAGSQGQTKLTVDVTFAETAIANRWPLGEALPRFAARATEIIKLFDTP